MQDLDEALRLVDAAGYTVTDDRRLVEYYAKHENRLSSLLGRAKNGDQQAANQLLKMMSAPGHIPYSRPLSEFAELLAIKARGWDAMTQDEREAAWNAMTPEQRRVKMRELLIKHNGKKTPAGREVGISHTRVAQLLPELKGQRKKLEAPLTTKHGLPIPK
ncbi:MAG: hypothetical protein ACYC5S_07220 [Thiobacillus sp.]